MFTNSSPGLMADFQAQLSKIADKKTKDWWERYLRNEIEFRGVNLLVIRARLHPWYKDKIAALDLEDQLALALAFCGEKYAEDKLTGVLLLQDFLYKKFPWKILLPRIAEVFQKGHIHDWNVCDWFCVRVLGRMIKDNGLACAQAVTKWNTSKNVWQARASLVAFANLTKHQEFKPLILQSSSRLIKREERFAKTAVGWLLRELVKSDKVAVIKFIGEHRKWFSKESLENAIKNLSAIEKKNLRRIQDNMS